MYAKLSEELTYFTHLIRTRTCAYQGVSNVSFGKLCELTKCSFIFCTLILHTYFALFFNNRDCNVNYHITTQCILTNSVASNLFPESAKLNQLHCRFGISNTALTLVHWKDSRKVEELVVRVKKTFSLWG